MSLPIKCVKIFTSHLTPLFTSVNHVPFETSAPNRSTRGAVRETPVGQVGTGADRVPYSFLLSRWTVKE